MGAVLSLGEESAEMPLADLIGSGSICNDVDADDVGLVTDEGTISGADFRV